MADQSAKAGGPVQNWVVARYRDGRTVKGVTYNFGPQKRVFHVAVLTEGRVEGPSREVFLSELKAVFFVRSLEGQKDHPRPPDLFEGPPDPGGPVPTRVKITFVDGEVLVGTTQGYDPGRIGFFVVPLEKDSNNLRVFVLTDSVKTVETRKGA
jgi:hypothetical protein